VLHYIGIKDNPAAQISLRAIDPDRFSIVNEADGTVIEEIEESKAFFEVYDGAVYMYQVSARKLLVLTHGAHGSHLPSRSFSFSSHSSSLAHPQYHQPPTLSLPPSIPLCNAYYVKWTLCTLLDWMFC
jgi:hypothetical protein